MIDGTITANGRVFIINRDGMLFGRNAVINTAGFLASTNDIRNDDFMAGRMNFNIPGRRRRLDRQSRHHHRLEPAASPRWSRPACATPAPSPRTLGTVALASGNSFTLDMYGDKLIQLAVGDEIAGKVIDVATGKPLSSLVSNEGTVSANGGRVETHRRRRAPCRRLRSSTTRGVIEANSVGTRNGMIVLGGATASTKTAGLPKQTIKVSGKITATGKDKGSKGGTIQITGEDIQFAAAMLDVSGHSGGGKILVGGDYGGGRPIPGVVNNQSAVLENDAIPTATTVTRRRRDHVQRLGDRERQRRQGDPVVGHADHLRRHHLRPRRRARRQRRLRRGVGQAAARLHRHRRHPRAERPSGHAAARSGRFQHRRGGGRHDHGQSRQHAESSSLTSAAGSGGSGDITVNAPITWSSFNGLTLSAYRNVVVNANITNTAGYAPVTLRADNTGTGTGTVSFAAGSTVSTFGAVSIFYNPTSYTSPTDYSGQRGRDRASPPTCW